MADDNILEIGATINLSSFLPGMDKMVAATTAGTGGMAQSFRQLATVTASSTAQMTTAFVSVPASMQVIPPAIQKVLVETESGTGKMSSAWTGLAGTVRTAGAAIVGTLTEVGAKMSETAERSRLGVGTMETAFAGLSSLLGAGIAVGFAAHFLDESARVVIELQHLNVETGISIQTLSGLRAVAQQTAIPFDSMQTALIRMQRAQVLAVEGNKTLQLAFQQVHISLQQLKTMNPEQLFFALAKGMAEVPQKQLAITTGMQVMGRGAYTLIPLLREQGTNLQALTAEAGKNSGVTDKAAESAMQWHKMTAQLAQLFQSFMIPVLQVVIPIIKGLQTAFEGVATAVVGALFAADGFAQVMSDVVSGNILDVPKDAKAAADKVVEVFTKGYGELKGIWAKPLEIKQPISEGDLSNLPTKGGGKDAMSKLREELDQMRDAQTGFHELSKADEASFWESKLSTAKKTSTLYRQIYHEYITAERAERRSELSDEMADLAQRLQATKSGSAERVSLLQSELAHFRNLGAEETSDYKRLQAELVAAVRERAAEVERLEKEQAKKQREMDAIDADAVRAHEQSKFDIERTSITARASLGLISGAQRLSMERQIISSEIDLERQALEEKLAVYAQEPVEYERVQKQMLALTDKYNKLMAQVDNEELKQRLAGWQRFEQQFTGGFSSAVAKVLETGRGFGASLAQTWNHMVVSLASSLTAFLAKWLLTYTVMEIISHSKLARELAAHLATIHAKIAAETAANTQRIAQATGVNAALTAGDAAVTAAHVTAAATRAAADTTAATTGLAATIATNVAKVLSEAAVAGAGGTASMAAAPFPIDLTAPAFGAAMAASAAAYAPLASAAQGGVLGQDMLVSAHAKEMILPPSISTGLQNLISTGGLNVPPALSQNFSSVGGNSNSSTTHSTRNVHVGSPKISITVNGDSGGMKDIHKEVVRTIKRAVRNGELALNEF